MSAAAGGALGEAHRVPGDMAEAMGLLSRTKDNSIDGETGSRRRSLRKREGKSYAEFGEADFIIEDDNSGPNSPVKGLRNSNSHKMKTDSAPISNGDVEMESEDDSDDDGPLEPLPLPKEYPLEVLEERKALIRQLQTQLRNEEMSLVLLKKIRQSQIQAEQAKEAKISIQPTSGVSRTSQNTHRGTPPLGATGSQKARGSTSDSKLQGAIKNSGVKGVLTPDLSHLKPVSVDPKNLPTGLPANLVSLMSKGTLGATKLTEVSKTPKMDTETPAQKQAAAKLALRKQLEKTLLQIPPPKPPPPEMHFIPNPTNTEFICLLGLEECVSKILNEDKENSIQPVPFSCSQCGTDFTPTWKWDKGAKGKEVKVICEQCVTTNVKKALKAEHTNRLKAAFVKALQQEQELEAHMAAQASQSSSSARIASPDSRGRNSVDVTVRPASSSASNRSIPSAHQTSRTTITTSASASADRTSAYRGSPSSATISRSVIGGGSSSGQSRSTSSNNLSSLSRSTYNNGGLTNSSRSGSSSSSSKADLANSQAMAAQVAAMLGMGAYGNDANAQATSLALLQAAMAQQTQQSLLMGGFGGSGSSSGSSGSRSSSSNHTGSSRSGSSSAAASASSKNDLNSQIAAMSQLMNPLNMYNYQAMMAMMSQAMTGSSGSSSGGSGSGSSGNSSSNAARDMMEMSRQAAVQQYMLDMLPGAANLTGSWGSKK